MVKSRKQREQSVEEFIAEVLEVDSDGDIKDAYLRIGGDLARYNARYADAYRRMLTRKDERNRLFGELMNDRDYIASLEEQLGKKPSLDQIKSAIDNHEDYQEAKDAVIEAEYNLKLAQGYVDAIRKHADMLQMYGAFVRDEMSAEERE